MGSVSTFSSGSKKSQNQTTSLGNFTTIQKRRPKLTTEAGLKALGEVIEQSRGEMSLRNAAKYITAATGYTIGWTTLGDVEKARRKVSYDTLAIVAAAGYVKHPRTGEVLTVEDFMDIATGHSDLSPEPGPEPEVAEALAPVNTLFEEPVPCDNVADDTRTQGSTDNMEGPGQHSFRSFIAERLKELKITQTGFEALLQAHKISPIRVRQIQSGDIPTDKEFSAILYILGFLNTPEGDVGLYQLRDRFGIIDAPDEQSSLSGAE